MSNKLPLEELTVSGRRSRWALANESDEQKNERLARSRANKRIRIEAQTPEEREAYRERERRARMDREYRARRLACESETARALRLAKMEASNAKQRQRLEDKILTETPEEREIRLARSRERTARRLACESEAARTLRLAKSKAKMKQLRAQRKRSNEPNRFLGSSSQSVCTKNGSEAEATKTFEAVYIKDELNAEDQTPEI